MKQIHESFYPTNKDLQLFLIVHSPLLPALIIEDLYQDYAWKCCISLCSYMLWLHVFFAHLWFVHPPLMLLRMTAKLFVGHPIVYFLLLHLQYTRYKYVRQRVCNDQGIVHSTFWCFNTTTSVNLIANLQHIWWLLCRTLFLLTCRMATYFC